MRSIVLYASALLTGLAGGAAAQTAHPGTDSEIDQALVANALSAAPATIAAGATVVAHDGRVLRQGTSDWVCLPDLPDVPNNSPMCLDAPWRAFIDALMHKRPPTVTRMAFGYMLQGDMPVSNTDPFATGPSPANQWLENSGPHVMILLPDPKLLDALPSDAANGGPYVMWKGTAYAHLMVPASPRK